MAHADKPFTKVILLKQKIEPPTPVVVASIASALEPICYNAPVSRCSLNSNVFDFHLSNIVSDAMMALLIFFVNQW